MQLAQIDNEGVIWKNDLNFWKNGSNIALICIYGKTDPFLVKSLKSYIVLLKKAWSIDRQHHREYIQIYLVRL